MNQCAGERQFLLHASGQIVRHAVAKRFEPAELHQSREARKAIVFRDAIKIREQFQVFLDRKFAVKAKSLRHITRQRANGFRFFEQIEISHAAIAGVRFEDAQHDAHGGGFAGTIGTDEAEYLAFLDFDAQVIECSDSSEFSCDIVDGKNSHNLLQQNLRIGGHAGFQTLSGILKRYLDAIHELDSLFLSLNGFRCEFRFGGDKRNGPFERFAWK